MTPKCGLKHYMISQFLWIRNPGTARLKTVALSITSGSSQLRVNVGGSPAKLTHVVVGRTQISAGCWTPASVALEQLAGGLTPFPAPRAPPQSKKDKASNTNTEGTHSRGEGFTQERDHREEGFRAPLRTLPTTPTCIFGIKMNRPGVPAVAQGKPISAPMRVS